MLGNAEYNPSERRTLSLWYPLHCWWCWRALPAAIKAYVKSLHSADHHPNRIGGERERLVIFNRFARDDKEPGPSWGKQLPGERPRETAET
jgi:hypothetical protein